MVCDALHTTGSSQKFRRKVLPLSSGSKSELSKKQVPIPACFLLTWHTRRPDISIKLNNTIRLHIQDIVTYIVSVRTNKLRTLLTFYKQAWTKTNLPSNAVISDQKPEVHLTHGRKVRPSFFTTSNTSDTSTASVRTLQENIKWMQDDICPSPFKCCHKFICEPYNPSIHETLTKRLYYFPKGLMK